MKLVRGGVPLLGSPRGLLSYAALEPNQRDTAVLFLYEHRICALFALAGIVPTQVSEPVALVIGNSAYQETPKLDDPRDDATTSALRSRS